MLLYQDINDHKCVVTGARVCVSGGISRVRMGQESSARDVHVALLLLVLLPITIAQNREYLCSYTAVHKNKIKYIYIFEVINEYYFFLL